MYMYIYIYMIWVPWPPPPLPPRGRGQVLVAPPHPGRRGPHPLSEAQMGPKELEKQKARN